MTEVKNNPRVKSILLPIDVGTTFLTPAVPILDMTIKEQQAKEHHAKVQKLAMAPVCLIASASSC